MAVITKQELEDAAADAFTLERVVNGSATEGGTGVVTTRLGTQVKTAAKVIADLSTVDVGSSAAALINQRLDQTEVDLAEVSTGPITMLLGSDHPVAKSRGLMNQGPNPFPTIFGWRSIFKHNGTPFNAAQFPVKSNTQGRLRVDVIRGSNMQVIASGSVEVTSTLRTVTVVFDKTVRNLAVNEAAYLAYYDPDLVLTPSYPGGGAYDADDPSTTTYPDQLYQAPGIWTTTTPVNGYRIGFRLYHTNLETRNFANELTALNNLVPSLETKDGVLKSNSEQAGVFRGLAKLLVDDRTPSAFYRGDYKACSYRVTATTIYGWRSPFKHNGASFNLVRISFRTNSVSTATVRLDILKTDGTILASGSFIADGGTTATTYYVPLSRTVTPEDLPNGTVAYLRYYSETEPMGYPAGGAYAAGDADPSVYPEQYYQAGSKTWTTATPAGSYRIQFDVLNMSDVGQLSPAVLSNPQDEIRNAVVPYLTWKPSADTEMDGNDAYTSPGAMGLYEHCPETTFVTAVEWRLWKSNPVNFEWRAYIRDNTTAFNMETTTRVAEGTIPAAEVPTTTETSLFRIEFPTRVKVPAGKYLYVIFKPVDDSAFYIRRWTLAATGRHGFVLNVSGNGWNAVFGYGTGAYLQTAPKFYNQSDELRSITPLEPFAASVRFTPTAGLASTDVQAAIKELSDVELVVPTHVYAVAGREANVYFDNLLLDDATNYNVSAIHSSSLGIHQNERWTWTPSGAAASGSLAVSLHHKRTGAQIVSKTIQTRAAASSAGSGTNKKVVVIGDSLVASESITQTLLDVASGDVMGVTLYGTKGTAPNKHEGRGGWSVYDYTGAGREGDPNPFWDGSAVNFQAYLTANGYPAMDWVFIALGINDTSGQYTDSGSSANADTRLANLMTLVNSIKASNANTKVALVIPPPPSADQDSFGANYGAGALIRWRFKRSILVWARQMIANYSGQEANRVYLVPSNVSLDTVHNMVRGSAQPANSRSTETVARQGNGVHPAVSGYQQIGDAFWAFLKYFA